MDKQLSLETMLDVKRNELKKRTEMFMRLVQSDIDSYTFEQNAIQELILMSQIKYEIKGLEFDLHRNFNN